MSPVRRQRRPIRTIRLGVLVSGKGSNLRAILEAIRRGRVHARVAVVISDRPEAPALAVARRFGCEVLVMEPKAYLTREQFDEAVAKELQQRGVELVVLAGYLRIVTPALIEPFRDRIMNVHPALLPAFPGLKAPWQAIEHGVKVTGCTVHFVTPDVDRGPIIMQAAVAVRPGERDRALAQRIQRQEHRIYPRAIELFARGRLRVVGRTVRIVGARASKDGVLINPAGG
jgi:phosphoribosylglycinamide formyltransferase-1